MADVLAVIGGIKLTVRMAGARMKMRAMPLCVITDCLAPVLARTSS